MNSNTTSNTTHFSRRRSLLLAMAAVPLASACAAPASMRDMTSAQKKLAALEKESGGRLGVAALNTADGAQLLHRGDERFAFCSTFKVIAASAILTRSNADAGLLQRRIRYTKAEMVNYSPITEKHLADGMTVAELCAAALQYSDNSAVNLLMKILGGPEAVTAYARSIGDREFRLERWETMLNSAIPGDPRDTSTPVAMMHDLQRLVLGDALTPAQREQLRIWLLGNTTGATRIHAGVPAGWQVGDKTGTGDYGTTNDIGVVWPSGTQAPLVIALYFTQNTQDAAPRNDVLASATRVVIDAFS
ncbi:class A beta-lactamase [Herbaspirillum autotrophicum]|uniref:class A beta-lactamase n=1 Tax=Herbaspirillum autotrophicum TaxID=180195 RepID=UPI00067C91EB